MIRSTYNAVLASRPAAEYGTNSLGDWIQENVITIILLAIAATVLIAGVKGNISKVVTIIACMLLGLFALGVAVTPGAGESIGKWAMDLVKN